MPTKKTPAKKAPVAKKAPAKKAPVAKKAPAKKAAPKVTAEEVAAAPKVMYRGSEVSKITMATRPEGYVEVTYMSAGSAQETTILSQDEFAREFGFEVPEEIK